MKFLIEQDVVFDSERMTLSRGNASTSLTVNETVLLSLLIDGIASKQAIMSRIWEQKGIVVTDASYHQLVRALRVKLGEQEVDAALIKTLPRRGLQFVGAVTPLGEPEPAAATVAEPPDAGSSDDNPSDRERSVAVSCDETSAAESHDMPVQQTALQFPGHRRRGVRIAAGSVLVAWAAVLAGLTFWPRDTVFAFHYRQTVNGIHYYSTGQMQQSALLKTIGVTPPPGSHVYQIERGKSNWLAVCPQSIYQSPELCNTYFVEQTP
ncbi:helix-turn-helix domain-containing protein [Burkholderia dolosa]|uniref:transcriptional regulator n=1 Tax=Burkholderia dolosa TaxID=152500 RepID=UPI0015912A83|nr:helix-turn-helix domain-containing protein [Burkholderia dolosa]MBR8458380.1 helix-turn-helix domain-containing protein [Burkholderia dolosa]